jgi:hypothetical protein
VVTGAILGFLSLFISRQAVQVQEAPAKFDPERAGPLSVIYKPFGIINGFIRKSGEKYRDRKTHSAPAHQMPRWSMLSTSLIILMFVAFFGLILNGTFFPEGEIPWGNGQVISSSWLTVGIPVLLTLFILFLRGQLRRSTETAATSDNAGIPWDFIAILITGLAIVGLGIGVIVYFNIPV